MDPSSASAAHPIEVVAHRGASADAPEHTLAAYRLAIDAGADALECDVRMTADGHLVCVHDRRVDRTSDGRGAVSALELADLAELDFGAGQRTAEEPRPPGETAVLTLERLLQLVEAAPRPVGLAIETKHPTRWAGQVEQRLLEQLREHGLDTPSPGRPQVRVMSFSLRSLQRVRRGAEALPTVLLTRFPRLREGRLPPEVDALGPSVGVVRHRPDHVRRWTESGRAVHVWTVDEPEDVRRCVELGVNALITNRPGKVLAQLGR